MVPSVHDDRGAWNGRGTWDYHSKIYFLINI